MDARPPAEVPLRQSPFGHSAFGPRRLLRSLTESQRPPAGPGGFAGSASRPDTGRAPLGWEIGAPSGGRLSHELAVLGLPLGLLRAELVAVLLAVGLLVFAVLLAPFFVRQITGPRFWCRAGVFFGRSLQTCPSGALPGERGSEEADDIRSLLLLLSF